MSSSLEYKSKKEALCPFVTSATYILISLLFIFIEKVTILHRPKARPIPLGFVKRERPHFTAPKESFLVVEKDVWKELGSMNYEARILILSLGTLLLFPFILKSIHYQEGRLSPTLDGGFTSAEEGKSEVGLLIPSLSNPALVSSVMVVRTIWYIPFRFVRAFGSLVRSFPCTIIGGIRTCALSVFCLPEVHEDLEALLYKLEVKPMQYVNKKSAVGLVCSS